MGRKKLISNSQVLRAKQVYDNKEKSMSALARELGVTTAALSLRIKELNKISTIEPIQKQANTEEIEEEFVLLLWKMAQLQNVNELRVIDVGRFQKVLEKGLGSAIERVITQDKLIKGTRGGYSLPV